MHQSHVPIQLFYPGNFVVMREGAEGNPCSAPQNYFNIGPHCLLKSFKRNAVHERQRAHRKCTGIRDTEVHTAPPSSLSAYVCASMCLSVCLSVGLFARVCVRAEGEGEGGHEGCALTIMSNVLPIVSRVVAVRLPMVQRTTFAMPDA